MHLNPRFVPTSCADHYLSVRGNTIICTACTGSPHIRLEYERSNYLYSARFVLCGGHLEFLIRERGLLLPGLEQEPQSGTETVKSWDPRGPMIWDNVSIFRTNCSILTSYIRANPRTCRGFSRVSYRVA